MSAMARVRAERARQVAEGYDEAHDDAHAPADLTSAAMAYATFAWWQTAGHVGWTRDQLDEQILENIWPWDADQFHPDEDSPLENLTRSAALLAAEIERIERTA